MPENPVGVITAAISASAAGEYIDIGALKEYVRSTAPDVAELVVGHSNLAGVDVMGALDDLVEVIDRQGAEAGKVALVELLERLEGALGHVVPRRAPALRAQEEAVGWTPTGPLAYVDALVEDAETGYGVESEQLEEDRTLVTGLAERLASLSAAGRVPENLVAVTRALPAVLDLLEAEGSTAARTRLDELAVASRADLLGRSL